MNPAAPLKRVRTLAEQALIDLLDGISAWEEIQYTTGLSEERSQQILEVRAELLRDTEARW